METVHLMKTLGHLFRKIFLKKCTFTLVKLHTLTSGSCPVQLLFYHFYTEISTYTQVISKLNIRN